MKNTNKQYGFTVVELLISLFIAAAFLLSGYQLFDAAIKDGSDSSTQSRAGSVAYEYIQRYKSSATNPCTVTTPFNSPVTVTGLSNVTITVAITCPYAAVTSISKITSTVQYGSPSQTVVSATYVKP